MKGLSRILKQSAFAGLFCTVCFGALALVSFLVLSAVPTVAEESAKSIVEVTVNKVQDAVKAKKGAASVQDLDQTLKDIIYPVFDFREMSQRCLGQNWKTATPEQQKEFVDLFSELLAKNYLKKIREYADTSSFQVTGETKQGADKSLVKTKVNYDGQSSTIDYRLRVKNGSWKVYDVIIENIGLVSNYRSEFSGIIRNEKMDGLLVRLRNKN